MRGLFLALAFCLLSTFGVLGFVQTVAATDSHDAHVHHAAELPQEEEDAETGMECLAHCLREATTATPDVVTAPVLAVPVCFDSFLYTWRRVREPVYVASHVHFSQRELLLSVCRRE